MAIRGTAQRGQSTMGPPPRLPSRQTSVPSTPLPGQRPCHMPYCSGNLATGTRFCPLCGTQRQDPQGHSTPFPPYGYHPYFASPSPSTPAPSVNLTVNVPSQQSSSPFEFPARDSVTPAPPATDPPRGVKRERSPSSSLQGESEPPRLSRRERKRHRKL